MSKVNRWPRLAVVGLASIVLVAAMLAGWMLHDVQPTQTAQAAGPSNDYPWWNTDDCSQKFGIYSWCLNGNWLSPLGFGYRNCTDYAAYELNEAMGGSVSHPKFAWADINVKTTAFPDGDGNARAWRQGAINHYGAGAVNGTPAVGAVAWWGKVGHGFGHVGIVASVSPDRKSIVVYSYNEDGHGNFYPDHISTTQPGVLSWPEAFLHIADAPSASGGSGYGHPADYAGKIVQWDGDHKQQRTSWLVSADLKRYWIPDSKIYWCLRGQGHEDAGPLSAQLLDQLPDQTGHWATCSSSPTPTATAPVSLKLTPTPAPKPVPTPTHTIPTPPTPTPTPTPPPPPTPTPVTHYYETAGPGGSHTFTNYTNAGGTIGPPIGAYTTVEVSCRLQGFKVADGNTWWYRISQSPWSNAFYASADNYYNNGQVSGSLVGTPFYDSNVPLC